MRSIDLSYVTIAGKRHWALTEKGGKPDLTVTDLAPGIQSTDVLSTVREAQFSVRRGKGPLNQDLEEAKKLPVPCVTFAALCDSAEKGSSAIFLNPKGRPPANGAESLTERVEVRLTRAQRYILESAGGAGWIRDQLDRKMLEQTGTTL